MLNQMAMFSECMICWLTIWGATASSIIEVQKEYNNFGSPAAYRWGRVPFEGRFMSCGVCYDACKNIVNLAKDCES